MASQFGRLLKELDNGHVLGASALVVLPLEILSWPSITPVMVLAALGAIWLGRPAWSRLPLWLLILSGALVALGAASAVWSLRPMGSLKLAAWLLGIFVTGLVLLAAALGLGARERERCERGLVLGFLAGLVVLELMVVSNGGILEFVRNLRPLVPLIGAQRPITNLARFDTAMTFVALLAWPVIGILLRRHGPLMAFAVAGWALTVVLEGASVASKVAFGTGMLVFFVARLAPKAVGWVIGGSVAVAILAAPWLLRPETTAWAPGVSSIFSKEASMAHRIGIWRFTIAKIDEKPILGWGLDSARWMPGGDDQLAVNAEALPLHPHDGALQLRLDLGVIGALLGAGFALAFGGALGARRGDRNGTALALALATTATALAMVSYDLWHIWWQSMLWLSGAYMVVVCRSGQSASSRPSSWES